MFKALASKFNDIFSSLSQVKVITEEHIEQSVKEIRLALLEADVSLEAVKSFTAELREKFIGEKVVKSTKPIDTILKLTQDKITDILNDNHERLKIKTGQLNTILMVGLQGAGKTTTTGKLAMWLKNKGERVLIASLDTRRPAAQLQLQILAEKCCVSSLPIMEEETPVQIAKRAIEQAKKGNFTVLLLDSAGRTEVEKELMDELIQIKQVTQPTEILLVMDSLLGRQSLNVAQSFDELLQVNGVILTRMESDTRGGIAFNIKYSLKKPIKFYGIGEKIEDIEEFYPERIASRILDMGDVMTLVEKANEIIEEKEMEKMKAKMEKGKFDFDDFLLQMKSLKKLGGISSLLSFIPGASKLTGFMNDEKQKEKQKELSKQEAIIHSMTKRERKNPDLLINSNSRKYRIAGGSGLKTSDINRFLKQFSSMKTMMQKMGKMDLKSMASMENIEDLMKTIK